MTTQVPYSMLDASVAAAILAGNVKISGDVVQVVTTQSSAVATGTTVTPGDDTIPQITEGTEVMTVVVTPQKATSTLRIDVALNIACSISSGVVAALHQDAIANALAAGWTFISSANTPGQITLSFLVSAASTTARTYRVRIGPTAAATVTFNGASAARIFGGVMASSITVTEIAP